MNLRCAEERLNKVIYLLAVRPGDVRKRLIRAFTTELCHLPEEVFPEDLREAWRTIIWMLTKHGHQELANGKIIDSCTCTMERIRNSTGSKIAEKIYDIWYEVKKRIEYGEPK